MLKITLLIFTISFSAQAKIKSYFPVTGQQAMVNMKTKSFMEEDDPSPKKLYDGMNVTPESSIGGVGKKITTADKNLSIICADQGKGQFFCNLVAKKSNICNILRSKKSVICKVNGSEALELFNKFFVSDNEFFYQNESGELTIQSLPHQFVIKYTEWN